MPNGKVEEASNMDKLHHNMGNLTKDVHIVPGIECNFRLSITKFVDANYRLGVAHISMLKALEIRNFSF